MKYMNISTGIIYDRKAFKWLTTVSSNVKPYAWNNWGNKIAQMTFTNSEMVYLAAKDFLQYNLFIS